MTDWSRYNTPRIWAMVANEDDVEAWRQVAAWGDVSDSVKDQRGLLENAREKLIAAWPPGENKSSEAFLKELDTLLDRMDTARVEADDTATGLANILEALRQAKNQIEPLYQQHQDKSTDIVPAWWDHAEDEIDEQARAHMVAAETVVRENTPKLRVPEPYALEPKEPFADSTDINGGKTGSTRSGAGSGSASSGGAGGGAPRYDVPHNPPPPLPGPGGETGSGPSGTDPGSPSDGNTGGGTPSVTTPGSGSGPGLSGVITPPGATPPGTVPPGTVPPGATPPGGGTLPGPGSGGGGFLPGPIAGGGGGGLGSPIRGGVSGAGAAGGIGGVGRGTRPGVGRALPSGAVIGETVGGAGRGMAGGVPGGGAGRGVTGGVPGGGGAGRGAVGGIGGRGGSVGRAGTSRPGRATAGAMTPEEVARNRPPRPSWLPEEKTTQSSLLPGTGRGSGKRSGDATQPPFDPDNPWQVAEGVDPVINPSATPATHDPGPGVIGWRP
ncbi:hypothetical protein [Actinoplanes sp. N902-109]|uniref:hypothetical protein n=1 Tax=Actinoplanes sp. (strain N902-109) TaxID=649831 RepID=UPI0003296524|nr:hypothetical protein [Actinoplanes sp. N902-109]AGL20872.1 hypothetical protein L083_7362 [Actinoplanes sp. N902-109]